MRSLGMRRVRVCWALASDWMYFRSMVGCMCFRSMVGCMCFRSMHRLSMIYWGNVRRFGMFCISSLMSRGGFGMRSLSIWVPVCSSW